MKREKQPNQKEIPNQRLNNTMSQDEYFKLYDLADMDVFTQQMELLDTYETSAVVLGTLLKALNITSFKTWYETMNRAELEMPHFKEYLRNQIQNNELSGKSGGNTDKKANGRTQPATSGQVPNHQGA